MKRERQEVEEYLECDGCQYLIGLTTEERNAGVDALDRVGILIIPWESEKQEFHFHVAKHRQDCFRYWAHNPKIMRLSLEERNFTEGEIDLFMGIFLYRDNSHQPGLERIKE